MESVHLMQEIKALESHIRGV